MKSIFTRNAESKCASTLILFASIGLAIAATTADSALQESNLIAATIYGIFAFAMLIMSRGSSHQAKKLDHLSP